MKDVFAYFFVSVVVANLFGMGLGICFREGSTEQARQYMLLRSQGYIETRSGGLIWVGKL